MHVIIKILDYYEKSLEHAKQWQPIYAKTTYCESETIAVDIFESDFIGNLFDEWRIEEMLTNPHISHFFDAQTGSGKTTFIIEKLFPLIKKCGKRLCILSPRVSLASHIKKEIIKRDKKAKEIADLLSEKGLRKTMNFGDVDILTYQSCMSQLSNDIIASYGAVVLDESHYFLSDSTFNRETEAQLDFLIKKFSNICRIYISATPKQIFHYIYTKEQEYYKNSSLFPKNYCLHLYYFKRNYSYIRPIFIKEEKLLDEIKKSNTTHRWIIFTDSKKDGFKMQNDLNLQFGDNACVFYDSEAKNDERSEEVNEMIEQEDVKKKVTILTSAFDVGININTKNISIAILPNCEVEFLQEIGRKRALKNEMLEVYIVIPSIRKINSRIKSIQKFLEEFYEEKKRFDNNQNFCGYQLPHPFYWVNRKITYNSFSIIEQKYQLDFYQKILSLSTTKDLSIVIKKLIYSWLELPINEDIESKESTTQKLLNEFVSSYHHSDISKEECENLAKNIPEYASYRNRSKDGSVTSFLNKYLKPMGYQINKVSNEEYYEIKPITKEM